MAQFDKLDCKFVISFDAFNDLFPSKILFRGINPEIRGTCYVVYEDIYNAKEALEGLQGFSVGNRLVFRFYDLFFQFLLQLDSS